MEKAWGPDHTSTLDTVNNFGVLYADQGKLDGGHAKGLINTFPPKVLASLFLAQIT